MPWKNGGGTTTEIAVHPEGAGLDTFEWRVSMARVETDGPFSNFAGVDRTLAVLDGEGIVLDVKGSKPVTLQRTSKPLSFQADVQTSAELVSGPITDLNVMTRRRAWAHSIERVTSPVTNAVTLDSETTLVLVADGEASLRIPGDEGGLAARDCAIFDRSPDELVLTPHGACTLFVVRLDRA
jgi:environmental stress-induced protein Ves